MLVFNKMSWKSFFTHRLRLTRAVLGLTRRFSCLGLDSTGIASTSAPLPEPKQNDRLLTRVDFLYLAALEFGVSYRFVPLTLVIFL